MPAYISLVNWTEQGVKNAKDTLNRAKAAEEALVKMGGRKIGIWWTLGQYDLVYIFEAPDDVTATKFLVSLGMKGFTRTNTMRCFSEEEAASIMQGLP
jgi:uncharacterized protein with GYD domain